MFVEYFNFKENSYLGNNKPVSILITAVPVSLAARKSCINHYAYVPHNAQYQQPL